MRRAVAMAEVGEEAMCRRAAVSGLVVRQDPTGGSTSMVDGKVRE